MKKTKTQKGITLVALIITVIVLLILAGVTIGSISGDGIVGHAKNTKQDFEKLEEEELLKSAILTAPSNITVEYLQRKIGNDKAKVYEFGDEYIIKFLNSERIYCIDSELKVGTANPDLIIPDDTLGADGSETEEKQ